MLVLQWWLVSQQIEQEEKKNLTWPFFFTFFLFFSLRDVLFQPSTILSLFPLLIVEEQPPRYSSEALQPEVGALLAPRDEEYFCYLLLTFSWLSHAYSALCSVLALAKDVGRCTARNAAQTYLGSSGGFVLSYFDLLSSFVHLNSPFPPMC